MPVGALDGEAGRRVVRGVESGAVVALTVSSEDCKGCPQGRRGFLPPPPAMLIARPVATNYILKCMSSTSSVAYPPHGASRMPHRLHAGTGPGSHQEGAAVRAEDMKKAATLRLLEGS
jgi:hypothetical protein